MRGLTSTRSPPHGDFSALFAELASSWRGWEGTKDWSSLEGELSLTCSCDALGHVSVEVELRAGGIPAAWQGAGTLMIEAGQLACLARDAADFLAD